MFEMLESFQNPKIIVTNANPEERIKLGIVDMPYPVFSLNHEPDKTNPVYFERMLSYFELTANDVLYFEHNSLAVEAAKSLDIHVFLYDKDKKDIKAVKLFLQDNL